MKKMVFVSFFVAISLLFVTGCSYNKYIDNSSHNKNNKHKKDK